MPKKTRKKDRRPARPAAADPHAEDIEAMVAEGSAQLVGRLRAYLNIVNAAFTGEQLPHERLGDFAQVVTAVSLHRIADAVETIASRAS